MTMSLYSLVKKTMHGLYNSRIKTPPILDAETYFPEAKYIAGHWQAIRDEALDVAKNIQKIPLFHELMPEQAPISANDAPDWRMFILRGYNMNVADNMAKCPTLARLINETPSIVSAGLSFMAPHKKVPMHTGPFRGIIRYYLSLVMPLDENGQPGVILTIAGKDYRLAEGEYLVWDDTYEHGVVNTTDQLRIVLLVDVYRAHMPLDMDILSRLLIKGAAAVIRMRKVFD